MMVNDETWSTWPRLRVVWHAATTGGTNVNPTA